jgi:hypothetical protein
MYTHRFVSSCCNYVHGTSGASSRAQSGLKEHLKAEEVVTGSGVDDALSALQAASKVQCVSILPF